MALILDTGVLYAALDRRDPDHEVCRRLIETSTEDLVVPAPVLPEVDYFLTKTRGDAFVRLLHDIQDGNFLVADLEPEDYLRIEELVTQYQSSRIGFVDAAVMAIVERLKESKVATLDHRHFSIVRPRHVDHLTLLP
jgi:predicted nucleic acid-binding protein